MGGIQAGLQLHGQMSALQEKKKQREILRMLGDPDKLTEESFYQIAQYDPKLATQMYAFHSNMQAAKANKKSANIKAAFGFVNQVNELGMGISTVLQDLPEDQRVEFFTRWAEQFSESQEMRPYLQAITSEFMDPETGQPDFSDEHLATLPFRIQAAQTIRDAEEAAMVRADQSRIKQEEAEHKAGLDQALETQKQEGRVALEGQRQRNRVALAERQAELKDEPGSFTDKVAKVIRDARSLGVELNRGQATVLVDEKRLQTATDPETGQETYTNNRGDPIDMTPVDEYIRLKSGGKPKPERMELGAQAGAPSIVMDALRGGRGTPEAPATSTPATGSPTRLRRRGPPQAINDPEFGAGVGY